MLVSTLLVVAFLIAVLSPLPEVAIWHDDNDTWTNYTGIKLGSGHVPCTDIPPASDAVYISLLRICQLNVDIAVFIRFAILFPL
ncbi:unnamed protein product, partial [Anisakis simplex]|uniref:Secreted protein n=1 Tax=Anisakis simplex TaxID=6269 RepID=A0A0M3JQK2_ANISI